MQKCWYKSEFVKKNIFSLELLTVVIANNLDFIFKEKEISGLNGIIKICEGSDISNCILYKFAFIKLVSKQLFIFILFYLILTGGELLVY